ncbi:hypothetical protein [Paenibacillus sp. YPG26]|uniref:hypothetical protein n=1 Tax=Paenibacillus sp. YPG26 TaxID=2878915 RepID=UPI00203DF4BD|nr:hypothetical protein [Paenibacillus sp. YPG26]USB32774.1 hypothetical protein LDO05_16195 [Paenibacillus sp. YPG26]
MPSTEDQKELNQQHQALRRREPSPAGRAMPSTQDQYCIISSSHAQCRGAESRAGPKGAASG